MSKFIVTTTINKPTVATLKYCEIAVKKNWKFVIVGDLKTPHAEYKALENDNVIYLSPEQQESFCKELSDVIGWKTIQRRNIGFVYADFINMFRDGKSFQYGDILCKGYGSYYFQKINNEWRGIYITPNINNITLSHLVCLPNHPRMWRRSALMECENYSERLPICDDYEILLRTLTKYKVVKNNKIQYIQYMNDNGNNFSYIRNNEINRIGPNYIRPIYYNEYNINNKMKELNVYEDEKFISFYSWNFF